MARALELKCPESKRSFTDNGVPKCNSGTRVDLEENVAGAKIELTREEWRAIEAIAKAA